MIAFLKVLLCPHCCLTCRISTLPFLEKVDFEVRKLHRQDCLFRQIDSLALCLNGHLNSLGIDKDLAFVPNNYRFLSQSGQTWEVIHCYSFINATAGKQIYRHPRPFIAKQVL